MKITDKLTITNEDNMLMMARYPDKYFDLAIVDPEYGIGEAGKNHKSRNTLVRQKDGVSMRRCPSTNYSRKDWDDKPAGKEYFDELFRVSKDQFVFGANYFESIMTPCKPPKRSEFDSFLKDNPTNFIIWDKVNGTNDFNDCELIWTSLPIESYVLKYMWAGMMQGVSIEQGTVMQGNKALNEIRFHPTQKPVIIYKYLIGKYSQPRFKIIDTHHGSGSISIGYFDLISYWRTLGHDISESELVACDLDKEYYDKSITRISRHTYQQLFTA